MKNVKNLPEKKKVKDSHILHPKFKKHSIAILTNGHHLSLRKYLDFQLLSHINPKSFFQAIASQEVTTLADMQAISDKGTRYTPPALTLDILMECIER